MINQDKVERIARKLVDERQNTAKRRLFIPLDNIKKIQIIIYPAMKRNRVVGKSVIAVYINGPAYDLEVIRVEISRNRIEFKDRSDSEKDKRRKIQNGYEELGLSREQAIEIIKNLKSSEYVHTKPALEGSQKRGENSSVDVYKTNLVYNNEKVLVYNKFSLDKDGVFVVSFHPDKINREA